MTKNISFFNNHKLKCGNNVPSGLTCTFVPGSILYQGYVYIWVAISMATHINICTYGNGALVVAPVICCHFVGECASSKIDASFMDVCRMYAYFCMQERVARALIWNARIESMKQTISKFCNTTQIFPSIVPPDCTLLHTKH